jgi:hypothetical protein
VLYLNVWPFFICCFAFTDQSFALLVQWSAVSLIDMSLVIGTDYCLVFTMVD